MNRKKVLVVDDSPTDRMNLENILNKAGFQVSTAESGAVALEWVKTNVPDCILLDIIMPDVDGYRTCRALKKSDATKHVPVIFVSSKKEAADRMWAERQGCNGYIVKPAGEAEVLSQMNLV